MKIKIIMFLILGLSVTGVCFAQSLEPSLGSQSSSTGVSDIKSDSFSSIDSSAGYDSGNHGNVS